MMWFRYVLMEKVGEFLAKGWTIVDDMADIHHGRYSVLMKWEGEGEPD